MLLLVSIPSVNPELNAKTCHSLGLIVKLIKLKVVKLKYFHYFTQVEIVAPTCLAPCLLLSVT